MNRLTGFSIAVIAALVLGTACAQSIAIPADKMNGAITVGVGAENAPVATVTVDSDHPVKFNVDNGTIALTLSNGNHITIAVTQPGQQLVLSNGSAVMRTKKE